MKNTQKWLNSITKHNLCGTTIYRRWEGMKDRCYNINRKTNRSYRRKGIQVCKEWINDPKAFADWSYNNGFHESLT